MLKIRRMWNTYTACSSNSFAICSDMFLIFPILSDIRSIVSSWKCLKMSINTLLLDNIRIAFTCLLSISCCCSSWTIYSLNLNFELLYSKLQHWQLNIKQDKRRFLAKIMLCCLQYDFPMVKIHSPTNHVYRFTSRVTVSFF